MLLEGIYWVPIEREYHILICFISSLMGVGSNPPNFTRHLRLD